MPMKNEPDGAIRQSIDAVDTSFTEGLCARGQLAQREDLMLLGGVELCLHALNPISTLRKARGSV